MLKDYCDCSILSHVTSDEQTSVWNQLQSIYYIISTGIITKPPQYINVLPQMAADNIISDPVYENIYKHKQI